MAARKTEFWDERETRAMLEILSDMNIRKALDARKQPNGDIFKQVAEKMKEIGYVRLAEQVRNRWKILKSRYYFAKEQNNPCRNGPAMFPYFDAMHEMLGHRPLSNVSDSGVDLGFDGAEDEAGHSDEIDAENTRQDWRRFNTTQCTPFERVLLEGVREMDIRLTHLTSMVASLVQAGRRRRPGHVEDFGDAFPIPLQNMEALNRLEEHLQNIKYKRKMINILSQSGGHNLRKTVWRIAKKMFTTSLAKNLNWCGRGDKRGLKASKCAEVIIRAAMKNPLFKCSAAEVEKCFKYFLRLAPRRK